MLSLFGVSVCPSAVTPCVQNPGCTVTGVTAAQREPQWTPQAVAAAEARVTSRGAAFALAVVLMDPQFLPDQTPLSYLSLRL